MERQSLATLMSALGPQGLTILDGWTTRDLAAHLVLRERRPDAAAGILVRALHGYSERVRQAIAARPYPRLVEQVRRPAWFSPFRSAAIDELANTLEFYIHHEDVRRAQPAWRPRQLPPGLEEVLWKRVPLLTRTALRGFPATVLVEWPGHGSRTAGAGGEELRLVAAPSELVLFLFGRQRVTHVELAGPPVLTQRLRDAKLGI
jgi:uncharacterized protein (TIGR03085 family)